MKTRCDCYGCEHSGTQGVCGCFECSECGAKSDVVLEVLDTKRGDRGPAYRPCAECAK